MRRMRWTAALLGAGLALAGCSAGDSATDDAPASRSFEEASGEVDGTATSGGAASDEAADAPMEDAGGGSSTAGDGVVTFGGTGDLVSGRQLARTASIVLEVEDVEQAAARVTAAAQRAGGFVSGADVRGGDFGSGVLTLRVPARALDATITDLGSLGVRVVSSSISTDDLTEQLTDLGARISNLERLETELQALLADVRDSDPEATQLLQVFERINQVRGEIERLEAQRTAAQDRVSLATINVELVPTATAPDEVEPTPEGTLAQAWQATQDAFGRIADALIWLVVTILPVALTVLGIPAVLLVLAVRAARRRNAAATPPPPGAPGGAGDHSPTPHDDAPEHDAAPDGAPDHDPDREPIDA